MILNLLLGKYGTARMKIMLILLGSAGIGFSVLISGCIAYFRSNLDSVYVLSGVWLNVVLFAAQISLFVHNLINRKRGEQLIENITNPGTPNQKIEYEYQEFEEGRDIDANAHVIWDTSNKPIPLDQILHHKDEFSYQRLYVQKQIYEDLGNENAANIIRNLFKPWTRNIHWETHSRELKLVKGKDAPKWKPKPDRSPSPTDKQKSKNAVPA